MALVVEDGTGKTDAEAYISEADADTYHTAHTASTSWSGADSADKEAALRMATQYLDAVYYPRWQGYKANETQRLAWPRANVIVDAYALEPDEMPRELTEACAELALRHITETNGLLPDVSTPGTLKSKTIKVDVISTSKEWIGGAGEYKKFSIVESLLGALLTSNTLERG
jgi:hypothetical protein